MDLEPTPIAGRAWPMTMTVSKHGWKAKGVEPVVRIERGGVTQSFPALPGRSRGRYGAWVVFPSAGRWHYEILVDGRRVKRGVAKILVDQ